MKNLTIPDSLTDIGVTAFHGTPWIERLGDYPVINGVLLAGPSGENSVVIPDGVTTIGAGAFAKYSIMNYGDACLKSVSIPDSVTKIDDDAFLFCDGLVDINIPSGVTHIGAEAFWGCEALTDVPIPNGVTAIYDRAFYCCRNLTGNITIPNGVKTIGESAFGYCEKITGVSIPDTVNEIKDRAFCGCADLSQVTIPGSVKTISKSAFSDCTSLTNVTIPDGVTELGFLAFGDCSNLTSVTIPSSVTKIDKSAFGVRQEGVGWNPLKSLTIHGTAGSYAETYAKENNIAFAADVSAAPVQPSTPASPTKFTDVAASSPFVDAINWAVEKNITTGKTANTFAPGEKCTNGQILTFLWRASGSPEPTIDNPFTDSIPASFQKAAVWAYEKGLVSGAVFGASTPCTRAVIVTYLWKAAGSPESSENASFADVPVDAGYAQAVAWAVENGVTSGTGNGQFSPDTTCTRGQIVTFLHRAMEK